MGGSLRELIRGMQVQKGGSLLPQANLILDPSQDG